MCFLELAEGASVYTSGVICDQCAQPEVQLRGVLFVLLLCTCLLAAMIAAWFGT